jgi:hypothetical protein
VKCLNFNSVYEFELCKYRIATFITCVARSFEMCLNASRQVYILGKGSSAEPQNYVEINVSYFQNFILYTMINKLMYFDVINFKSKMLHLKTKKKEIQNEHQN